MIVVDASALLEALLRTPAAAAVEERLFDVRHTLHVPHLIDIEVAQVLRRYVATGQIEPGSTWCKGPQKAGGPRLLEARSRQVRSAR